jgi:hypothetical protein
VKTCAPSSAALQPTLLSLLCSTALTAQAVLLAYSGGASSRVALDAAAQVMHCGRKRRWRFNPTRRPLSWP